MEIQSACMYFEVLNEVQNVQGIMKKDNLSIQLYLRRRKSTEVERHEFHQKDFLEF